MSDKKLTPREAIEEIRKLRYSSDFIGQLGEILSRVQPEEQRGHARRCHCCPQYERPHSSQSSCKCPNCFCTECGKRKNDHPYRDPRCAAILVALEEEK